MVTREETENASNLIVGSEFKLLENTPHPIDRVDVNLIIREM